MDQPLYEVNKQGSQRYVKNPPELPRLSAHLPARTARGKRAVQRLPTSIHARVSFAYQMDPKQVIRWRPTATRDFEGMRLGASAHGKPPFISSYYYQSAHLLLQQPETHQDKPGLQRRWSQSRTKQVQRVGPNIKPEPIQQYNLTLQRS